MKSRQKSAGRHRVVIKGMIIFFIDFFAYNLLYFKFNFIPG
jgi:hypothetical protein